MSQPPNSNGPWQGPPPQGGPAGGRPFPGQNPQQGPGPQQEPGWQQQPQGPQQQGAGAHNHQGGQGQHYAPGGQPGPQGQPNWQARQGPGPGSGKSGGPLKVVLIVAAIIVGVGVIAFGTYLAVTAGQRDADPTPTPATSPAESSPSGAPESTSPAPTEASPSGEVDPQVKAPPNATEFFGIALQGRQPKEGTPHLVIYVDYMCPPCATSSKTYLTAIQTLVLEDKITAEVRAATFLDPKHPGNWSTNAARAAASADMLGYFDDYHEALLGAMPAEGAYTEEILLEQAAQSAGMTADDLAKFQTLYAAGQVDGFVSVAAEKALEQVQQVPTYRVSGQDLIVDGAGAMSHDPQGVLDAVLAAWETGGKQVDG